MKTQTVQLRPPGALQTHSAEVIRCDSEQTLRNVFAQAKEQSRRLTLIGARRSFGQHFLPVEDGLGVDLTQLQRSAVVTRHFDDGRILIRASGGTTFEDLHATFPDHRVRYAPTSDRITIAGALAACAHCSGNYFASEVHGFRLLAPNGEVYECTATAEGLARELFEVVPGSFGALGVTTFLDLVLWPIAREQLIGIHSVYAASRLDHGFLSALEAAKDNPRFDEGVGGVIYGNRGRTLVLADERLPIDHPRDKKLEALLCDEDLESHAFTQGLANRFPRIAESTVSRTYPRGMTRWAHWYGFQFYQRGYDRAPEVLGRNGLKYRLARLIGVDARVPVAHQSWFFPRSALRPFVEAYFSVLDEFPGLQRQVEQQDIVLLGPSRFPAHSMGRTQGGVGVLTSSYSLSALAPDKQAKIIEFFGRVTRVLYERIPETRVSLCKQVHCDAVLLRQMHAPWIELMGRYKTQLDPAGLLTSRHLETLLGSACGSR